MTMDSFLFVKAMFRESLLEKVHEVPFEMTCKLVTNNTQQTHDVQSSPMDHSTSIMVIHQISQTMKAEDALHFTTVGPKNSFKTKFLTKHSQFFAW